MISQYNNLVIILSILIVCIIRFNSIVGFFYNMLGAGDKVSSRRTVAFMSAGTFCGMAIYGLINNKPVDHWVGSLLCGLSILCLGLTTLPQIMELIKNIKNIIPQQTTTTNEQSQFNTNTTITSTNN